MGQYPRLEVAIAVGWLAGLLMAGLGALTPTHADEPAPVCDARCVLVTAVKVVPRSYAGTVALTGDIEPKYISNIAFRVSGKIDKRLVEVGDHVAAETVLAQLDPRDQQANVDTAKAGLVSAQALLTQAQTNYERQATLYKQGYATRPAYDQAEQQLRTQRAAVESAKAALGTAQEQFGYVELKAGVPGIITARNAEAGQVVEAGTTVFTLAQDGGRDAVFDLYEALVATPPTGKTVIQVYLQSDPRIATSGHPREISPSVDPTSGTVKVKVGLEGVPPQMSLGAPVVGVGSFRPREAIVLPRSALYRWHDKPAVWTVDAGTRVVQPRNVEILRYTGDDIIVSQGVAPGEMVVTAGLQFLYPGQVVGIASVEPPK